MADFPQPPEFVRAALTGGLVIPAHPLALTADRKLDEVRQRALTRYYHAAGAGGIAIGVHTTQFEIRRPEHGLFEPVLKLAAETITQSDAASSRSTVRIAGICGETAQAVREAQFAREHDYHAGLLSLAALRTASDPDLVRHAERIAHEIPLIGFYLQPAAGGRLLSLNFWRRFVEIPNVLAIKIAAFNRYQTFEVIRAVAESGRAADISLYTGNDDNIVLDLLTPYRIRWSGGEVLLRFTGGLLGHWACWTRKALRLLNECKTARGQSAVPSELLSRAVEVTDCNAAFFDAANQFAGCIPGIHEVLRRQGLLESIACLNPDERLSPGQTAEIDRVYRIYPHLNDDAFVRAHLGEWLA
jgi:hypothetical protein